MVEDSLKPADTGRTFYIADDLMQRGELMWRLMNREYAAADFVLSPELRCESKGVAYPDDGQGKELAGPEDGSEREREDCMQADEGTHTDDEADGKTAPDNLRCAF